VKFQCFSERRVPFEIDTATCGRGLLVHVLKRLQYIGPAAVWIKLNGPGSIERFVRAVRARFFADKDPLPGRIRAFANELDPPRCRCGKPGTRRYGGATFCVTCGPPTRERRIAAERLKARDEGETEAEKTTRAFDREALHLSNLRRTTRSNNGRQRARRG
jgi:hypothetical protein